MAYFGKLPVRCMPCRSQWSMPCRPQWKDPRLRTGASCLTGLLTLAAVLAGGAARAQQDAPKAESLGEIVVTATKRVTTLQETPISITAASGDELIQHGVPDISSLAAAVPGVSIQSVGPGRTNFNIRGLSDTGRIPDRRVLPGRHPDHAIHERDFRRQQERNQPGPL